MVAFSEVESELVIFTNDGMRLGVMPSIEDRIYGSHISYDFVSSIGDWYARISLDDSSDLPRPEFRVEGLTDDSGRIQDKRLVLQCARTALGLMAIDTKGRLFGGVTYDTTHNDLDVRALFPDTRNCYPQIRQHYVGQAAIRNAIPEGFLGNQSSYAE